LAAPEPLLEPALARPVVRLGAQVNALFQQALVTALRARWFCARVRRSGAEANG